MFKVNINSIDAVKTFVIITGKLEYNVTLVSGAYVVDGKSIMGVFSLDLSKPIEVRVDDENIAYAKEKLAAYVVD